MKTMNIWRAGLLLAAFICDAVSADAPTRAPTPSSATVPTPAPSAGQAASPDAHGPLVKRGEYLARAADCMSCHSASSDKPYAGGVGLKSAFGTIYSTNITSDRQSGIGDWTRDDFERALRQGVRKDGAYLYPAMPYTSYTKISDADIDALWGFIHSLPAVSNTIPKNTLPFPLNIRTAMSAWQALYLSADRFAPVAGKSAAWNRGAYLVEGFGHCTDCHTPRSVAQGTEKAHQLTGANVEGWYAPDISNDAASTLKYWNVQDLATYLKTGKAPGNVKSFGPMQEVVHNSLRYLTDADLKSMALYLKDQSTNAQPLRATKVSLPRVAEGQAIYEENCASCHQSNGRGIKSTVPALAHNDSVTAAEPYNVVMAMLEGFEPQGTWGAMASFAALSDDQISATANYVRTAWGNNAAPNATPWSVGDWRKNVTAKAGGGAEMLCPDLTQNVLAPALKNTPDALRAAASDSGKLNAMVAAYQAARPASSKADVIEGLSTAYCRAITTQKISQARMSAQISSFAQRVAQAPVVAQAPARGSAPE